MPLHLTKNDLPKDPRELWFRKFTVFAVVEKLVKLVSNIIDNTNAAIKNIDDTIKHQLGDKQVRNNHIDDYAVTEDKIADDSITNSKVLDKAISTDKLSDDLKQRLDNLDENSETQGTELVTLRGLNAYNRERIRAVESTNTEQSNEIANIKQTINNGYLQIQAYPMDHVPTVGNIDHGITSAGVAEAIIKMDFIEITRTAWDELTNNETDFSRCRAGRYAIIENEEDVPITPDDEPDNPDNPDNPDEPTDVIYATIDENGVLTLSSDTVFENGVIKLGESTSYDSETKTLII